MSSNIHFIFFGGEPLAVPALEKLFEKGYMPSVIVCNPDKPAGRNLEITAPPVKIWALEHNIPVLQPEKLDSAFIQELKSFDCKLGIVVSYGKIIPKEIVDLPELGLINIHPSLLPLYRGPSPIVAPILNGDSVTGVTIIKIDAEMDHGPILAQEKVNLSGQEYIEDLEKNLAELGAELLVKVLSTPFTGGEKQDESKATFCKKIKKEDGEIKLEDEGIKNWRKFQAYHTWPRTFFFQDGKRIIVTKAKLENNKFIIEKVIPEGGKEVDYKSM